MQMTPRNGTTFEKIFIQELEKLIMTNPQNFIMRDDTDRHDVYFSVLNQYHLRAVQSYNRLCREIKTLDNNDQVSEDYESDIMSAVKDMEVAKLRLSQKLERHRRAMGW